MNECQSGTEVKAETKQTSKKSHHFSTGQDTIKAWSLGNNTINHMPLPTPLLVVATDGSCLGNPGAGGWCWFVDEQCYAAGGDPGPVTNNMMEILALLRLLEALDSNIPAVIEIDSKYVINAVTLWYHNWRRKGWITSNGTPVANAEALKTVINLLEIRKKSGTATELRWVRGHSGSQRNERADTLARTSAEQARAGQRSLRTNVGTLQNLNTDTP